MPIPSIAVLVGSLRKESINARLARALIKLAGGRLAFQHVEIGHLPLFSQDLEPRFPAAAQRLKYEIQAAQGVLIVSPEYNRGVPGVLKNAIDWASRPYGKNSFAGKPVAIAGASLGAIGTAVAQQQLRGTLAYLDAPTMGQPELFLHFKNGLIAADGSIANDDTAKFLGGYVDHFVDFVEQYVA